MNQILYDKKDYQELLLEMLEPLRKWFSEGKARIRLSGTGAGYSGNIIEMETFARPLWGLVPFWAGGGRSEGWEQIYHQGIASGTDPQHPEYWGQCGDYDQRFVEMAPIAAGILMAPEILWDPFSAEEKDRICTWISQINYHELPKCNWYYFRILVNLALKNRGMPYSQERLESDLAYMDACYLGDGWYVDGVSDQKDYYCPFAMEYYSQIYAAFAQAEDSDRCRRLKKRAAEFQREFILWFDWEGAALPYGRSLTYRMAQAAFWPASLLSGAGNCDVGEIKGIVNRNIRYWLSKNIFERDGILNVGYAYGNLTMAERYNSPGSPYWSMKIFLILALSDHHPYWSAQEKPFPRQKRLSRLLYAEMLIQQGEQGAFAYVPAVYNKNVLGHFVEKYGKFVYSTKFAFSVAHSCENLVEAAPDSMLAFVLEGEQQVYVRRRSIRYGVETDHIWSEWSPVRGISVRTEIWPVPEGHIRRHKIISDKSAAVFDCGFAVAMYEDGYQTESGNGESFAEVRNHLQRCRVTAQCGGMEPYFIQAEPNTNLLYPNTCIPAVWGRIEAGITTLETFVEI